jgi:hypothetical protein
MARERLIDYTVLEGHNEVTLSDGNDAGRGDLVRARLNVSIDAGGQELTNRDTLRIVNWAGEGPERLAVAQRQTGRDEWSVPFEVPVKYLEDNAELAYAGNVHVAQSRTVRTGHLLVSDTLTRESLYAGMTRGWEENTAHVATGPAVRPGVQQEQAPPEAVISAAMQREDAQLSATETIREAQAWSTNTRHLFELWRALTRRQSAHVINDGLRQRLGEAEYQRVQTDPQKPVLDRKLREAELAGHDIAQVLDKVTRQNFGGARSIAAVLHGRIEKLGLEGGGKTTTWAERTPRREDPEPEIQEPQAPAGEGDARPPGREWARAIEETVAALDHRQLELGVTALDKPPAWAVRYIGMPPKEPGLQRDDWMARIGRVASYREAVGHTDPEQAIGPYPKGNPELAEAYQASVRALEMQEEERVRSLSRGDLEARVQEYERVKVWAPDAVRTKDLESTAQAEKDALAQAERARQRDMESIAKSAEALRIRLEAKQQEMEVKNAARLEWEEATAEQRDKAREAKGELQRRGHAEPEPEPAEKPAPEAKEAKPATAVEKAAPEVEAPEKPAPEVNRPGPGRAEPGAGKAEPERPEPAKDAPAERGPEPARDTEAEARAEKERQAQADRDIQQVKEALAQREQEQAQIKAEAERHEVELAHARQAEAQKTWQEPERNEPEPELELGRDA